MCFWWRVSEVLGIQTSPVCAQRWETEDFVPLLKPLQKQWLCLSRMWVRMWVLHVFQKHSEHCQGKEKERPDDQKDKAWGDHVPTVWWGLLPPWVTMTESTRSLRNTGFPGTALVVQWLRRHAPNAGDPGLIHGQGTRSCMLQRRPSTAKHVHKKYQCSTYYLSLYNWERAKSFSSYPSYNTDLPLPWKEENQISTQTFSKSLTFTIWVETENHKIDSRGPEWRVGDTEHRCERREKLASAPFLALTSCISLGKPLNLSEPTFLDL